MLKKILAFFVCFAFLLLAVNAFAAEEILTLSQAVELAVKNSPEVLSAEQEVNIARQHVRDAKFKFGPQITLSGTVTRYKLEYPMATGGDFGARYLEPDAWDNQFFSIRAQILQTIYAGGRNVNNLKLAKAAHNRAKVSYSSVRSGTALAAKKAYLNLQYKRALLALAEESLKKVKTPLKKTYSAFEQMENAIIISSMEGKRAELALQEENASSELLRLISRDPLFDMRLDENFSVIPVSETLYQCLVTATESRSELQGEIYQAQMDDIAVSMALIRHYPTITLGAIYDLNTENTSDFSNRRLYDDNWMAMLSIRLPISYDAWSVVAQSRMQQRQGELKRVEMQDAIRSEIASSYRETEFWEREEERITSELAKAEKLYKAANTDQQNSAAGLRAAALLFDLKSSRLKAVYNQREARARLEWARGVDFTER